MLILLVFLSGLKLLSQGVDENNWQILGSKLHGFMEHHKKYLTNGNSHIHVLILRNCIFCCLVIPIQTCQKTARNYKNID